jgi:hypothetical protein
MEDQDMKRALRVTESLKESRKPYEGHYQQLEEHFMPRRGNFSGDPTSQEQSERGKLLNRKMLDGTPMRALRILQSGMQSGISSKSRPWFRLQPVEPDLRERKPVKSYVANVTMEMRRLAERSGLYNMLHTGYGDLGLYGTEAAIIEKLGDKDLRGIELVPGSYWLGMSDDRTIDTLYREMGMTVNQIVGKFVYKNQRFGDPDWGVVPGRIKNLFDKGDISKIEAVCQLITPRTERDERRMDGPNKKIASQYWLKLDDRKESAKRLSGDFGYDKSPVSASRWNVNGYEVYGTSPAMETLPDVKELFAKRRDYMEMLRRFNRPPMNAHSSLRNSKFSLMPDAINFMDDPNKGLVPAYHATPQFGPLGEDIEMSKDAIWSGMYADLFMMISNMPGVQPRNNAEIVERKEEKLIALGPMLERQHFEKHRPLVELLFERVVESGAAGEPPKELDGKELEIDFVSMLAQAQKAVSTGSMERFASFVGNMAAVKPGVLDKLDEDQSVDEYADMLGVPPSIVRSDDEVQEIRTQRAEAERAQQQAEQAVQATQAMQQGANAAKVLAETDGGNRQGTPNDILARTGLA